MDRRFASWAVGIVGICMVGRATRTPIIGSEGAQGAHASVRSTLKVGDEVDLVTRDGRSLNLETTALDDSTLIGRPRRSTEAVRVARPDMAQLERVELDAARNFASVTALYALRTRLHEDRDHKAVDLSGVFLRRSPEAVISP